RSPPAAGSMFSLVIAARIRFKARKVMRMPLAPSDSPSAVRAGDAGAAGVAGAAAAPFGVSDWSVTNAICFQLSLLPTKLRHGLPPCRGTNQNEAFGWILVSGCCSGRRLVLHAVLLLPVANRRADRIFGEYRAVNLHRR